jgi:hypothetical protein
VNLQTQNANGTLPSAKLISIGTMQFIDNRSDTTAPFLQVTGYVCNVGTSTANNCVLHVSATQSGNSNGIDSSANIETLAAGEYTKIDMKFPYYGTPLLTFDSNLEWDN